MITVSEMSARQKLFRGLIEKEEETMIKVETIGDGIRVEIAGRGKDILFELATACSDVKKTLEHEVGDDMADMTGEFMLQFMIPFLVPNAGASAAAENFTGSDGEKERMQEVIRTLFAMEEK